MTTRSSLLAGIGSSTAPTSGPAAEPPWSSPASTSPTLRRGTTLESLLTWPCLSSPSSTTVWRSPDTSGTSTWMECSSRWSAPRPKSGKHMLGNYCNSYVLARFYFDILLQNRISFFPCRWYVTHDISIWLFLVHSTYFCSLFPSCSHTMLCTMFMFYLNIPFRWNKHELIQVVVTATVTKHKNLNLLWNWHAAQQHNFGKVVSPSQIPR